MVLHSLDAFNKELVGRAPAGVNFAWVGMGYDYYDLISEGADKLFTEKTRAIFEKCLRPGGLRQDLQHYLRKLTPCRGASITKEEAASRVNFFSPVISPEYRMVVERIGHPRPGFLDWNYSLNGRFFDRTESCHAVSGNDILLGNSAAFSNNHAEAIDFIGEIDSTERRVICPLSYGNACYAEFVEKYGRSTLGERFAALRRFLPPDRYLEAIRPCSNVIMNHFRQQAAGNIAMMLFLGAKVFLNEENPLFAYYRSLGIQVFSMEELASDPGLLDSDLPWSRVLQNRSILREILGWEAGVRKTRDFIATAIG
ncbi:TDP-N-acetylfucosamine:lipid II N-acetylfucosaminyltransferase [Thiohalorhabdus methylotrophus]|uniref:TDP-N-acetylfucosamine:lipid II N-acetylfucosaminyltransferase n=1 Tax=Thiohalorhabdus methylotrophus TaxID=3242694 RepID=A0ABV4TXH3_9GAMM